MLMSEKQVSDLIIAIIVAIMVAVMVDHTATIQGLCQKPVRMVCHTDLEPAAEEEDLEPNTKPIPDRRRSGRHPRLPP